MRICERVGCAFEDRDALRKDVHDVVLTRANTAWLVGERLERQIGIVVVRVTRIAAHEFRELRRQLSAVALRAVRPHGDALQALARLQ